MNEDFIPFELAVKLKEKGLNEPCYGYYYCNGGNDSFELCGNGDRDFQNSKNQYRVAAPTIPQVLKWLREEKTISVEPGATPYNCWYYMIKCKGEIKVTYMDNKYKTYEVAALAGIKHVLDKLI